MPETFLSSLFETVGASLLEAPSNFDSFPASLFEASGASLLETPFDSFWSTPLWATFFSTVSSTADAATAVYDS